jgi:hypothetical protein
MRSPATICNPLQNREKQTQNPPALAVLGVRPPLPAPTQYPEALRDGSDRSTGREHHLPDVVRNHFRRFVRKVHDPMGWFAYSTLRSLYRALALSVSCNSGG